MDKPWNCLVVGLGGWGSSILLELAVRGWRVIGIDRFSPPHPMGSTHGESRALLAGAPLSGQPLVFEPLVKPALDAWYRLEELSGVQLVRQVGALTLGEPHSPAIRAAAASYDRAAIRYSELTAAEVTARFPLLQPGAGLVGVYEPESRIVFPAATVAAQIDLARRLGAEVRTGTQAVTVRSIGDRVVTDTTAGEIEARWVVLAAGAWTSDVAGTIVPVEAERQLSAWFRLAGGEHLPIFQAAAPPPHRSVYGFPDIGTGVKIALHHGGEVSHPYAVRRTVAPDEVARIAASAAFFLPSLGQVDRTEVCIYPNTADGGYAIGFHPTQRHIVIATGGGGFGARMIPLIGQLVAHLLSGDAGPWQRTFDPGRLARAVQ